MTHQSTGYEPFIERFTQWANAQTNIVAVRIVGSRATHSNVSVWADLDVEIFTTHPLYYRVNTLWIEDIVPTWIVAFDDRGEDLKKWRANFRQWTLFTTLEGGLAVDFIITPQIHLLWHSFKARLKQISQPEKPENILVDKKKHLQRYGAPTPSHIETLAAPTEAEYLWRVREFWGVADRATRYLLRGSLYESRRLIGEALKRHLVQMIKWQIATSDNGQSMRDWRVKYLEQWITPEYQARLDQSYNLTTIQDIYQTLVTTFELFRESAIAVGNSLNFDYPVDEDKAISSWILQQLDNAMANK